MANQDLKALKQEWESYALLAKDYPNKREYQIKADSLELTIIRLENDNGAHEKH